MEIPMEHMYRQRKDFTIIALTGISGSGCNELSHIMGCPFSEWSSQVRATAEIESMRYGDKRDMVFQREYDLCYHVCEKQYAPFNILKYRNVLLLCTLEYFAKNCSDSNHLRSAMVSTIKSKFDKSHELKTDTEDTSYVVNNDISSEDLLRFGLSDELFDSILNIANIDSRKCKREYRKALYLLFESEQFSSFCEQFYGELKRRDYYAENFFVHRLATSLRATGNPDSVVNHRDAVLDNGNVFFVVEKITALIKGFHEANPKKSRCFVIDAIRNSMEILYLRERYNAFYMIALHNDGYEMSLLRKSVCRTLFEKSWEDATSEEHLVVMNQVSRIINLSEVENRIDDFGKGHFYGPDISRCVTESEIHIAFHNNEEFSSMDEKDKLTNSQLFFSTAEQWMKFYALIIRPGLITPSRDERCMSVAYVAKFNSGCISRQVGCAIVDDESAIQSVGWNDPPSDQLPCQLRYADEICRCGDDDYKYVADLGNKLFSDFELHGNIKKEDDTMRPFIDYFKEDIDVNTITFLSKQGLRYPFCFRTRYNTYKGTKDQVNTRSLHAEENTMLRLARSGGQGLKGGIMYVTASPCVLCSKKAYQIGIKEIVYLDPYTDIAPDMILNCGYNQPKLRPFMGAIGETFYKLYKPFLPYKDELKIWDYVVKREDTSEKN